MKRPHRRHFLHLAAGAVALPVVRGLRGRRPYPTRHVRLVVGFPLAAGSTSSRVLLVSGCRSGSASDLYSTTGQALAQPRHRSSRECARRRLYAAAATAPTSAIRTLYDKPQFHFVRDTLRSLASPSCRLSWWSIRRPCQDRSRVRAYAKVNPSQTNMGDARNGSSVFVAGELFKAMMGRASIWFMFPIAGGSRTDRSTRRAGAGSCSST